MKFDVNGGTAVYRRIQGFAIIYQSEQAGDRGKRGDEIVKREPQRVDILDSTSIDVNYNINTEHVGLFEQNNPQDNLGVLETWLQTTYGRIPEKVQYLFE